MKLLIYLSLAVLGVSTLILIILHIKTLKPFRSLLLHASIGIGLMVVLNLLSRFTGFRIPVNIYSIVSVCVLGAPAVCGYLILNLIL